MKTFGLTLLLLLTALANAQDAGSTTADGAIQDADMTAATQLAAILEETRTLQADVDVLTLDQDGREVQESTALLVMQKPDHFYWEILTPYSELMLTDGERIWRYEPDLEQVSIEYFNDDVSRTPVMLLNGDAADIVASYFITAAGFENGVAADNRSRFILTPRGNDGLFTRLSLTFSGTTLEEMQFEDSLGQMTSLTFSGIQANTAIDPGRFVFRMPEGVDVIDNTQ